MPSPFPGMDPYLEDPEFFPGLHDRLINQISDALQVALRPPYYAEIRSRIWLEFFDRRREPDINILRTSDPASGSLPTAASELAVLPLVLSVASDEAREICVEIYTTRGAQQLVTAIEILSLTNKEPGEKSRGAYLQKQRELILNRVNLVEIDLLRGGTHTTAMPLEKAAALAGRFEYHVCVHRMDDLDRRHVYPIKLEDSLPRIAVPLLPGDADVLIDLQGLFAHCYDRGPYRTRSPYAARHPQPPLTPEQTAWATQLLREKGLLPAE